MHYAPMPPVRDKKSFTQTNLPLGPTHAVGTTYTALYTLGEDAQRPFGMAHIQAASFLNFVFYFYFFFSVLFFPTLNNLRLQKSFIF